MFASTSLLDQLISSQQRAIRYYFYFAGGLVALGLAVILGVSLVSGQLLSDAFKTLFGLGGAFVSSLSAFQIKEILSRKDKIQTFETIRARLHDLERSSQAGDDEARKKIDDLLWRVVEKTALS